MQNSCTLDVLPNRDEWRSITAYGSSPPHGLLALPVRRGRPSSPGLESGRSARSSLMLSCSSSPCWDGASGIDSLLFRSPRATTLAGALQTCTGLLIVGSPCSSRRILRVPRTLEEGAIDHDLLATIADVAVGDARVAVSILRTAARQAHQNHDSTITEDIVGTSVPEARAERHVKDVETLTPHRRRSTRLSRARGDFVE